MVWITVYLEKFTVGLKIKFSQILSRLSLIYLLLPSHSLCICKSSSICRSLTECSGLQKCFATPDLLVLLFMISR